MIVVGKGKLRQNRVIDELQSAASKDIVIGLSKEGDEDFSRKQRIRGSPIDVKVPRKGTGLAMLQHIQPPFVRRTSDRHVIGNDIQNDSQSMRAQVAGHLAKTGFSSQFRIDDRVIDQVVAVLRTLARGLNGGGIDVTDAKSRKVRRKASAVLERKAGVELEPIGGTGNHVLLRSPLMISSLFFTERDLSPFPQGSRRRQFGCS